MLNFVKKLFAKEEIKEEKVNLGELSSWLDRRTKPMLESLSSDINRIISKINNEKEKVRENIKILETAKLQNPKIPERAKTIMEGNRAAFIKKVSFFFDGMDMEYNNHNEILEKCSKIKNEIESLGKGTARSYQVLNEFFARQAENVAANIKTIENYSEQIKNSVKNSRISSIDKIKKDIEDIQNKIKLREKYSIELENSKNNFQNNKNKKSETEKKINELKAGGDYKIYEKLLEGKKDAESKLSEIEDRLFHDFSALEKALKKYAKIAFENENLILGYLSSPIKALTTDNDLKIIKILNGLEKNIINNKLELDSKKSEKTLSKIKELSNDYFIDTQKNYKKLAEKLNERNLLIENNEPRKELESYNKQLKGINESIENLNNTISKINSELEKINIKKLKENLQEEINDIAGAKIIIL